MAFQAQQNANKSLSKVLLNRGGHYNEATEKFMCPVKGLYLLTLAKMRPDRTFTSRTWAGVRHAPGDYGFQVKMHIRPSGRNAHVSNIVLCDPGQVLYIDGTPNSYESFTIAGAVLHRIPQHSTAVSLLYLV